MPVRLEGARWCQWLRLKSLLLLWRQRWVVPRKGTLKAEGRRDIVSLGDAAKCEVYVCFEGPLGAHLKQEVRKKLWKGEYVEIFSLLLLEKCNLDRVKPDDSKKEDEELVTCVRDNGKCHRGEESRTLFGDILLPGCYRGGLQGLWRYRMAAV